MDNMFETCGKPAQMAHTVIACCPGAVRWVEAGQRLAQKNLNVAMHVSKGVAWTSKGRVTLIC